MLRRVPAPDLLRLTLKQPLIPIPQKGHLFISFRAGLLSRQNGKLTADKRKGQLAVIKTDQGSTALQWFERVPGSSGGAEDFCLAEESDFEEVVLPEFNASFEWFSNEKRILKLVFKDEPARAMFFWMQEPERDKDAELLIRCNKAIKGANWEPPAAAGTSTGPATSAAPQGAARTAPAAALPPMSSAAFQEHLMRIIRQGNNAQGPGPESFGDVVPPEVLEKLIAQTGVAEKLVPFLPEHLQNKEELDKTPRSVQIWQQMGVLSQGIRGGQVNAEQFGVQPEGLGCIPFLEAVQKHVDSKRQAEKAAWAALREASGDDEMAAEARGEGQAEGQVEKGSDDVEMDES